MVGRRVTYGKHMVGIVILKTSFVIELFRLPRYIYGCRIGQEQEDVRSVALLRRMRALPCSLREAEVSAHDSSSLLPRKW